MSNRDAPRKIRIGRDDVTVDPQAIGLKFPWLMTDPTPIVGHARPKRLGRIRDSSVGDVYLALYLEYAYGTRAWVDREWTALHQAAAATVQGRQLRGGWASWQAFAEQLYEEFYDEARGLKDLVEALEELDAERGRQSRRTGGSPTSMPGTLQ